MEIRWKEIGKEIQSYFQNESVTLISCKPTIMNKELILKGFEKARVNLQKKGVRKPSSTDLAEELSNYISENENFKLGERSFRDYHNDAKKLKNSDSDISIKQLIVINGLCKYLGFEDYKAFVSSLNLKPKNIELNSISSFIKKNKITLITSSAIIIIFLIINSVTKQRWMAWHESHYMEVTFDTEKYKLNQLKIYKEEKIKHFKKVTLTCDYTFFNSDGSVRIWYGKNKEKALEFFTALGLHPETGKTLDPITDYMIDKYVCNK